MPFIVDNERHMPTDVYGEDNGDNPVIPVDAQNQPEPAQYHFPLSLLAFC